MLLTYVTDAHHRLTLLTYVTDSRHRLTLLTHVTDARHRLTLLTHVTDSRCWPTLLTCVTDVRYLRPLARGEPDDLRWRTRDASGVPGVFLPTPTEDFFLRAEPPPLAGVVFKSVDPEIF
jgi:hypothetical protein